MNLLIGKVGYIYCAKMSGVRLGRIEVPDPVDNSLDFGSGASFSFDFWMRTEGHGITVLQKRTGGYPLVGYEVMVNGDGRVEFAIMDGNGRFPKIGTTFVSDGCWHHVACVRYNPQGLLIYVDGKAEGVIEGNGFSSLVNSDPFIMGSGPKIDLACVRVWGKALSSKNVRELVGGEDIRDGIRAEWLFEGRGNAVHDSSGACCGKLSSKKSRIPNVGKLLLDEPLESGRKKKYRVSSGFPVMVGIVRVDEKPVDYSHTPMGLVQLRGSPGDGDITATYREYPYETIIGEIYDWQLSYEMTTTETGSQDNGFRTFDNSRTDWRVNSKRFTLYNAAERNLAPVQILRLPLGTQNIYCTWARMNADVGKNTPKNEIVNKPISFVGEGMLMIERSA